MWSLIERARKVIFALVLSIIPLVLLYVQSKDEDIRQVIAWPVTEVSGLVETSALAISGAVSDTLFRYFYLVGRADELIALRLEVQKTRALEAKVRDLASESASLKELYFRKTEAGLSKGGLGRVIGRAGAPMARMIRIDLGTSDGIAAKSLVIAHDGVVGQVLSTAPHFSDVLLITDASSAIDAKIAGSNARGLLRGMTSSKEYQMEVRIDGLLNIVKGDVVVTSGINSNFPDGVPIGHVTEVYPSPDGLFISARIKPFVMIDHVSHVYVLNKNEIADKSDSMAASWPLAVP